MVIRNQYVLVAGTFSVIGQPSITNFAIWNSATQEWCADLSGNSPRAPVVLMANATQLWAANYIDSWNTVLMFQLCTTGTELSQWNQWVSVATVDGVVYTIAFHNNSVYVGGEFGTVAGLSIATLARYDGVQWHALSGGQLSSRFGRVMCLSLLFNHTDMYVSGLFDQAGDVPGTPSLARYDTIGDQWYSVGGGFYGIVKSLAIMPVNNELYAGTWRYTHPAWNEVIPSLALYITAACLTFIVVVFTIVFVVLRCTGRADKRGKVRAFLNVSSYFILIFALMLASTETSHVQSDTQISLRVRAHVLLIMVLNPS